MTNETMRELAAAGLRIRVAEVEQELAGYFKDFPDLFASSTPPVLLKQDLAFKDRAAAVQFRQAATNGTGKKARKQHRSSALKAAWTPARRAAQGRRIKRTMKRLREAADKVNGAPKRPRGGAGKAAAQKWGSFAWQRAHDFLAGQPGRQGTLQEILKGARIDIGPSFISGAKQHTDVFRKVSKGVYALKKVVHGDEDRSE